MAGAVVEEEVLERAVESKAARGVEQLAARAGHEAAEQPAREALLAQDLGRAGQAPAKRPVRSVCMRTLTVRAERLREDVGEGAADAGDAHRLPKSLRVARRWLSGLDVESQCALERRGCDK
jgi:hypothetical protein